MGDLPGGTVTFLFTDVEGSTRLLDDLGAERYAEALASHRRVVRDACAAHGGVEVDTQGDAFFVAFPTAPGALAAARAAREGLAAGPIRVRTGVHTGTPLVTDEGYVGLDVHRAARIAAVGHGGQVLVSSSTAALVDGAELRDLGEHRLKDLSAPERLYQLGDEPFPDLTSLYRTNLPIPSTPFLGREDVLRTVVELLDREHVRLLTLTGPGGVGKTRLALQAAGEVADRHPDGVWWVPLAPLRDPQLVLPAAAQALGADVELRARVGARSMLLLLDNFEHVVDAASDLADLIATCPHLKVLVTSRERLRLSGEHELSVRPLAREEAVTFFVTRARAVRPGFEADRSVADICRNLDDLPLALELAAAQITVLTPRQVVEQLEQRTRLVAGGGRDAPERHRALRSTVEWSYELLPEAERQLFARLSVFAGGCTLDAVEHVCDGDVDTLEELVAKSMLRFDGARFTMLETIREYAHERLDEAGDITVVRRRHAGHYLDLAERIDADEWHGRITNAESRTMMRSELGNVVAALALFEQEEDHERELRLVALFPPGSPANPATGLVDSDPLARLTARTDVAPEVRARALQTAVPMARFHGNYAHACELAEEWLTLSRTLGDARAVATAQLDLGLLATFEGRYAEARARIAEVRSMSTHLSDDARARSPGWIAELEATLALYEGRLGDARERLEAWRAGAERAGETGARALRQLACIDLAEGQLDEAAKRYHQSLVTRRGTLLWGAAVDIDGLAAVAAARGRPQLAARLLGAADVFLDLFGYLRAREPYEASLRARTVAAVRNALGDSAFEAAFTEGRGMLPDEAVEYARATVQ